MYGWVGKAAEFTCPQAPFPFFIADEWILMNVTLSEESKYLEGKPCDGQL